MLWGCDAVADAVEHARTAVGLAAVTRGPAGSTVVVQMSLKTFLASRFFKTMLTGDAGAGKRNDS